MLSLFTRTILTPGLLNRGQTSKGECNVYLAANSSDLHSLALLLTGDAENAALCMARAYQLGPGTSVVFRDWLDRWAVRTMINVAIGLMRRELSFGDLRAPAPPDRVRLMRVLFHAPRELVATLPARCRFAIVMYAWQRYSVRDCALLLGIGDRSFYAVLEETARLIEA
jgi:DNA-directed RNA polymerase specialized sigma24 family protein